MVKRSRPEERVVGDWYAVTTPCPRCGGPSEARTNAPKQLGLPWAEAGVRTDSATVEWRCSGSLDECTGPSLEECIAQAPSLVPTTASDRPRRVDAVAPPTMLVCASCGATWGQTLARCPVDQGELRSVPISRRVAS